jgi:hypothetical protein
VVGYHARDVQDLLKRLEGPKLKIRTIFNPVLQAGGQPRELLDGAARDGHAISSSSTATR